MMKRLVLCFIIAMLAAPTIMAQVTLRVPIVRTATVTEEDEDENGNPITITFEASSDDAEQENDEIDALYDDDIDAGWEGADGDANILTAGMRFQSLLIPAGATINSAHIEVVSHEAKSAEDIANLTIYGEKTANASTFTEDALITARSSTDATVAWTVDEEWGLWTTHETPDLKDIVQEIVDMEEWVPGNAMAFIFAGEDQGPSEVENAREWESFENIADPEDGGDGQNHPDRVPVLVITYTPAASGVFSIPIVRTETVTEEDEDENGNPITITFEASSDDAEQENDEIDALFDDDIDAGWEGADGDANILTAGMRFQAIGIPQGAKIDSAFIEVFSHESKTADDVANITIYAEATDNAETFTEDALITARASTAAQVDWTVDEEWGLWTPHHTPDLKTIVQEIIDRGGWTPGNAIAFIFAGEDQGPSEVENAREWEAFENIADPEDGGDGQNHPERVPRLTIYYSDDDGGPVDPPVEGEVTLSIPIIRTETVTEEDEDENGNPISITFEASSDDAEQENDEIDALFDDDIDAGWEGADGDANILTAGMRFQNIVIPIGATINSAYIEVVSHEAKTASDVANLSIYAEKTANAATFSEDALITDRTATEATVSWIVDEEWGLWTTHQTPELKSIVQEIVALEGWVPGNSIAFIIEGEDQGPSEVENAREWESFENIADPEDGGDGQNHPDRVPVLKISYTPATTGAVAIPIVRTETVTEEDEDDEGNTITITFEASSDDAEQENDEIDALFDDDIDAGWEGADGDANVLTAGMRFQSVGIPQGATIDSAFIQVYSHESKTADDIANLTIYGEATDNAETFTEDALLTSRTSTSARISWIVDEEWGLWTPHSTPDLKSIVQEIVNRGGWEPGNSMAFIFEGEDQGPSEVENAREWESFENIADPEDGGDGQNHPERVPRLVVYFGGYDGPILGVPGGGDNPDNPDDPLSVIEIPALDQKNMYPNPAVDQVTLNLPSTDDARITIINLKGGVIMKSIETRNQNRLIINTSSFASGVYIIRLEQAGKKYNQRLIINR